MFFETGALKHFSMLKFRFNKIAGFQAKNSIKKRLQHRCFSVKFAKEHLFYRALPVAASGNLMKSLFIAYDNDESCHCVGRMALQRLIHFIARVSFLSISSFFLIFCGFYYLLRY